MPRKLTKSDGDIDIIGLLIVILERKWKIAIIILISILISLPFYFKEKNKVILESYEAKTIISQGKTETIYNYDQLIFKLEMSNQVDENFDASARYQNIPILLQGKGFGTLLEAIAQEFNNDKDYLVSLINKKISNDQVINDKAYILSKNFIIQPPTSKDNNYYLKFKWHDLQEGFELFNEALLKSKENLRNKIFKTSFLINEANKRRLSFRIKELEIKLETIKTINESDDVKIRNFKDFTSADYVRAMLEIDEIKNKQVLNDLDNNLNFIKNDELKNWTRYSWKIADIVTLDNSQKKHNKIIIFSFILGSLIGLIYVLVENAIRVYKKKNI